MLYVLTLRNVQIHKLWTDVAWLPKSWAISKIKFVVISFFKKNQLIDIEYILIKYDFIKPDFLLTRDLKEEVKKDDLNKYYLDKY